MFSGDFRQILPVVRKGSRGTIVNMCFKSSPLFSVVQRMFLSENMRLKDLKADPCADKAMLTYPEFLLKIGSGDVPCDKNMLIHLPSHLHITQSDEELIEKVFPKAAYTPTAGSRKTSGREE